MTRALTFNLFESILWKNSYFQPNFVGTEAPLFVIDHTWVPPPTKAQILQEEQQLYMACLLANIVGNMAAGVQAQAEAEHKKEIKEYDTFQGVFQATKDIRDVIPHIII